MKKKLFGRHLLILKEFLYPKTDFEADKICNYYRLDERVKIFVSKVFPREIVSTVFLLIIIILNVFVIRFCTKQIFSRISRLQTFYRETPLTQLPNRFIPNHSITLTLVSPAIRKWTLEIGNTRIISSNLNITVPARLLSSNQISGKIKIFRDGISRPFVWHADALQAFVPEALKLTVRSPLGTQSYSSIRNLEVWSQSRVRLQVKMSVPIASARSAKGLIKIKEKTLVWQTTAYRSFSNYIHLTSIEGQIFTLPKFNLTVRPNLAPTLILKFPLHPVPILGFPWKAHILLQAEDDLALNSYSARILITNKDPSLATEYSYTNFEQFKIKPSSSLTLHPVLKSQDFILLPDDVIQVEYKVKDISGKSSKPVYVTLIFPDEVSKQKLLKQKKHEIEQNINRLTNRLKEMQSQVKSRQNPTENRKLQKDMQNLLENQKAMQELSAQDKTQLPELEEKLQKLAKITRSIKENIDWIREFAQLHKTPPNTQNPAQKTDLTLEQLEQLRELLHQLEQLQKSTEWFRQMEEARKLFERLKTDSAKFEAIRKKYKESLKQLIKKIPQTFKKTLDKLIKEADKLNPKQTDTFKQSQKEWQKLRKESRQAIEKLMQKSHNENLHKVSELIDEAFLRQLVQDRITKLDTNQTLAYIPLIKSLASSAKNSCIKIRDLFNYVSVDPTLRRKLLDLCDMQNKQIEESLTTFRDHKIGFAKYYLTGAASLNARLFLTLLKLKKSLKQKASSSKNQSGAGKQQSFSLEDLLKMQQQLSQTLQKLLQKPQGKGLSPSDRETLKKLSDLQAQIRQNLDEMLKKSGNSALSGGQEISDLMDEVQKSLKSYRLDSKLLEKSKKIEEKLKKGNKAIKQKGLSDKRKAEQPGVYEISPPPELKIHAPDKSNLQEIKQTLPAYYRKLIKKILESQRQVITNYRDR